MEMAAELKKSKEPHMIPAVNLEGTATPPVAGASAAVGAASTRPMLYPPAAETINTRPPAALPGTSQQVHWQGQTSVTEALAAQRALFIRTDD